MKFNDFKYERPNLEEYYKRYKNILKVVGKYDATFENEKQAIDTYFKLEDELDTAATLVSIRNSVDTKDEFYEKEMDFFNKELPNITEFRNQIQRNLLKSINLQKLIDHYGNLMFKQYELAEKTFDKSIIPLLQKENELTTKYSKLLAGAEIEFQGDIYNLSEMTPFTQDKDRNVRKAAESAVSAFFVENEPEIDNIYDELVKLRDTMAKKLGYENYVQMGYDRLGRTDYKAEDVKKYRRQVYNEIVPYVSELTKRKAMRLKIENPYSYDLALSFLDGNPTPKGDREWQVSQAKKMYSEMSDQTNDFFTYMLDHDLMDLDSIKGKAGGGYCTYLPKYNSPFIFANFNGTSHDVDVLTHEAGHAFQVYQSRELIPEYRWPTMEAAEIHSMSMEFLAWPWIDLFFKEDTDKYKYNHLAKAVSFIPYGVLVDEFQHYVYENPNIDPKARKDIWRELEQKYLPFKQYENDFLKRGGYWFRQGHIFGSPFYYIDYTLAQVVAFQFWNMSMDNHSKALDKYLSLCNLGGSKSFLELLDATNLKNPFVDGTIKKVLEPIKNYLDKIEDSKL